MEPSISVVLPVYNGGKYLCESITSILSQTYANFELIIVNDGSTDDSEAVINRFRDRRIIYLRQPNLGLGFSLNRAIQLARSEYIARQDADDISAPNRLKIQFDFLESNQNVGIVGTWTNILVDSSRTSRRHVHPLSNGTLQFNILFDSFFVHSSVMMRKSAVLEAGMYPTDPERNPPEDFDLWQKIADRYSLANIGKELLYYREVSSSITRTHAELLNRRAHIIAASHIQGLIAQELGVIRLQNEYQAIYDLVALMRKSGYESNRIDVTAISLVLNLLRSKLVLKWPRCSRQINAAADEALASITYPALTYKSEDPQNQ